LPVPQIAPPDAPTLPMLPPATPRHVAGPTPPSGSLAAPRPVGLPQSTLDAYARHAATDAARPVAKRPRRGFWQRYFLWRMAFAVIGLIVGGVRTFGDRLSAHDDAPARPAVWDARVAPLVSFVETERGLTFEHPINVEFLDEASFVALFTTPPPDRSPERDAQARSLSQVYDAFGLASDYDMSAGESKVSAVTTLGLYTPDEDKIYVRGDVLTAPVRVVLAHELTHALQAQHFDVKLGGPDDLALRSMLEADAMRVERVYRGTLPELERQAADDGTTLSAETESQLDSVPWAVVQQRYAPYALGPLVVNNVFAADGNSGVDALIRQPPSEEVLISPWLNGTNQVDAVVDATVPAGATVLESQRPLSMLDTLVMLDAWLAWEQARGALDGWAGGGYVSYQRDGSGDVCFSAVATFDQSAEPFATAVSAWATASGSLASPSLEGNRVSFESCARGSGAAVPAKPVVSPIEAVLIENSVVAEAGTDLPADELARAQCYARKLIDDPQTAPLLFEEELTVDQQATFDWVTTAAAQACGLPSVTS
jgi:hypothetical protein